MQSSTSIPWTRSVMALFVCGAVAAAQHVVWDGPQGTPTHRSHVAAEDASAPMHGSLRVTRVDTASGEWTDASSSLVLPVGARVLLDYTLPAEHLVTWTGADIVDIGAFGSLADFRAVATGEHVVRIDAVDPHGRVLERRSLTVDVVTPAAFAAQLASGIRHTSGTGGAAPPFGSGAGIVSGGGTTSGDDPPKFCFVSSCNLTLASGGVVHEGDGQFTVTGTICNTGKCDDVFRIFGTPPSGNLSWELDPAPLKVKLAKGECKSFTLGVTFVNSSSQTLPVGPVFFDLYAAGGWTPVAPGGAPTPSCQLDDILSVCFSDCGATTWIHLGGGVSGTNGLPLLTAQGDLTAGSLDVISLSHAAPQTVAALFLSVGTSISVPLYGGVLHAFPLVLNPVAFLTSATGTLDVPFPVPAGVPGGTELTVQFAILDAGAIYGMALSNAIRGTFP